MFYSMEEFEAQMADLIAKGIADAEAYDIVRKREQEDAEEYEQWRREQDSRYDDQFELDTDYN
jgi:adenylosuccinate lyase